jgi:hypothetical protein
VLMFQDGFEQDPDYVSPATNSPIVGTYSYLSATAGLIQAQPGVFYTNNLPAPPNAPQNGTYVTAETTALVATGTGHSGTNYVVLANGLGIMPTFTTPIPAGSVLHAEAYINWTAGNVSWGFDAPGTNQFARLTLNSSFGITLFDGANEVDTGLGHSVGIWEYYELDYVVGSSSITVTVDGTPSTIPITPQSTIYGLFFVADPASSGSASVDDVLATADLGNIPATNPVLHASPAAANLVSLSWTNATGYVLQQNSNLANTNGWVNVAGGGVSPVQVSSSSTVFYRLSKPN